MERITLRMGDRMLLPGTSWKIRKFLIARPCSTLRSS